ncbi:hypothetical protein K488DRAFT_53427 [Vararia minispora EC-137]|uniref:Uncharacterized protein n=1 Tax=Vararia minispora EC-137 TaxID=1314806 RepID=A0ACB8QGJ2_9AGAM|nr:hypothetical protein K488DRAFT_53427 [Vararia minispora EC-137]
MRLIGCAKNNLPLAAVRTLITFKDAGLRPDHLTFHSTMQCFAANRLWMEGLALIEDMKAVGVAPDVVMFNHLLEAVAHLRPNMSLQVFKLMEQCGITPNRDSYHYLLSRFIVDKNPEMVIKLVFEMDTKGISPSAQATQAIVEHLASHGFVHAALGLAKNYEKALGKLDPATWVRLLMAATDQFFGDGVSFLWNKVVNDLQIKPTEGLCLEVLNVAGRFGLRELAVDALRALHQQGIHPEEHHLAPMVEVFARHDAYKDAFAVLCMLREGRITSSATTAQPIFARLQADASAMDAAWSALEELYNEGTHLSVTCVNVIIQAAVAHGDLQRAIGTYQLLPELGLKPTAETFNFLLSGAIAAEHRELGNRLMHDMKNASVVPDTQTYERFVVLCLGGASYEDAFFYLEEMKSQGHTPPRDVYEAIVRRCVYSRDERFQIALDEMKEMGYDVSENLQRFLERLGPQKDGWQPKVYGQPAEEVLEETRASTTAEQRTYSTEKRRKSWNELAP